MTLKITSYSSFLTFLLALGPKLQKAWPKLMQLMDTLSELIQIGKELFPDVTGPTSPVPAPTLPQPSNEPGKLSIVASTSAVIDGENVDCQLLEAQTAQLIAGPEAAFNVGVFRQMYEVLAQHPEALGMFVQAVQLIFSFAK